MGVDQVVGNILQSHRGETIGDRVRQHRAPLATLLHQIATPQFGRAPKHVFCGLPDQPSEDRQFSLLARQRVALKGIEQRTGLRDKQQTFVMTMALLKQALKKIGIGQPGDRLVLADRLGEGDGYASIAA